MIRSDRQTIVMAGLLALPMIVLGPSLGVNRASAADCNTLATQQECCSAKKCGGKVLSNRDAHNCADKSKGKSWHPASDGTTPAACTNL